MATLCRTDCGRSGRSPRYATGYGSGDLRRSPSNSPPLAPEQQTDSHGHKDHSEDDGRDEIETHESLPPLGEFPARGHTLHSFSTHRLGDHPHRSAHRKDDDPKPIDTQSLSHHCSRFEGVGTRRSLGVKRPLSSWIAADANVSGLPNPEVRQDHDAHCENADQDPKPDLAGRHADDGTDPEDATKVHDLDPSTSRLSLHEMPSFVDSSGRAQSSRSPARSVRTPARSGKPCASDRRGNDHRSRAKCPSAFSSAPVRPDPRHAAREFRVCRCRHLRLLSRSEPTQTYAQLINCRSLRRSCSHQPL